MIHRDLISTAALEGARNLFAPAAIEAVLTAPGFEAYLWAIVRIWPGLEAGDPVLTEGLRDIERLTGGLAVFHLARSPGGLTVGRLAALFGSIGLAPARATATIKLMRFFSLIEAAEVPGDRRVRAYRPTARMTTAFIARTRAELTALTLVDPTIALVLRRLDDPDAGAAVVSGIGEFMMAFLSVHGVAGEDTLQAISSRASGMPLLGRLLLAGAEEGGPFPPVGRVRFGVTAMAKACGVSRTQVRRVLRAGAEAGHFVLHGEGEVELTPHLAQHVGAYGLSTALSLGWSVRHALARFDAAAPSPPERPKA